MTKLKSIKLDFWQRQQAEGLIGWAHMEPGKAAARIVWQEGRIRELESTAQELLEALISLERTSGIASPADDPARVAARAAIAKGESHRDCLVQMNLED